MAEGITLGEYLNRLLTMVEEPQPVVAQGEAVAAFGQQTLLAAQPRVEPRAPGRARRHRRQPSVPESIHRRVHAAARLFEQEAPQRLHARIACEPLPAKSMRNPTAR